MYESSYRSLVVKKSNKRGPKCYGCGKFGHIKTNCTKFKSPGVTKDNDKAKFALYTTFAVNSFNN